MAVDHGRLLDALAERPAAVLVVDVHDVLTSENPFVTAAMSA